MALVYSGQIAPDDSALIALQCAQKLLALRVEAGEPQGYVGFYRCIQFRWATIKDIPPAILELSLADVSSQLLDFL